MSKKYEQDEKVQAYVTKKVEAALKAERKRVALAVKGLPLPASGSKREAAALIRSVSAAVAAPLPVGTI